MQSKIESTKDYEKFKFILGNRSVLRTHVNNLIESISQCNLLHVNPIIVNENFHVIDGQHRLLAAKQLDIEIYYMIIESGDSELNQIHHLNKHSKNWSTKEYVESHAALGDAGSIAILKTCKQLQSSYKHFLVTVPMLVRMVIGHFFKQQRDEIVNNGFKKYEQQTFKTCCDVTRYIETMDSLRNSGHIERDTLNVSHSLAAFRIIDKFEKVSLQDIAKDIQKKSSIDCGIYFSGKTLEIVNSVLKAYNKCKRKNRILAVSGAGMSIKLIFEEDVNG